MEEQQNNRTKRMQAAEIFIQLLEKHLEFGNIFNLRLRPDLYFLFSNHHNVETKIAVHMELPSKIAEIILNLITAPQPTTIEIDEDRDKKIIILVKNAIRKLLEFLKRFQENENLINIDFQRYREIG